VKQQLPDVKMKDFWYDLPDERIAKYPLPQRDQSKLLVWEDTVIQHRIFGDIPHLFKGDEILFFNNTKVIPARLFFRKATGALIEVFLLNPIDPEVVDLAMQQTVYCDWNCTIGNLKTWKPGIVLERSLEVKGQQITLKAFLLDHAKMEVKFTWDGGHSLVDILEAAGNVPIPPYLQRSAEESDKQNYQTVYSKKEGAVAAPTAGLHFTNEVIEQIKARGVLNQEVTLHVSAGTFKPVKVENAMEHDMHFEQVVVQKGNIEALLLGKPVVCVGTTAMRTLESLYWYGVKLMLEPNASFIIEKTFPYTISEYPSLSDAMQSILSYMGRHNKTEIHGQTQLYVMPTYQFRVCNALITNFHQPGSTLLLLVAAFVGEVHWRTIYDTAMSNDYRFLSYGDSSFLQRKKD
jgi:S-adenosylmethionine:tRNA ribosyltransferase-isomerase